MSNGPGVAPIFMYPDDPVPRLRRQAIASGVALVLLLGLFAVTRDTHSSLTRREHATRLAAAGEKAYEDGDYRVARARFLDATRWNPKNASAHFYLGLIMQIVDNNPAGAEAQYREAIADRPTFARALFNLGVLRAKAGVPSEAIALYRRAIAADDALAGAHFNLGLLLRQADPNSPEAVAELQRAVVLDPALVSRIPEEPTTTTTSRR